MKLLALGLNHETASIELRERATFSPDCINDALSDLTKSGRIREAAILSTCNRTEIYCGNDIRSDVSNEGVINWLSEYSGFTTKGLLRSLYQYPNEKAVRHAFRVASGLESMVLGEPQILGQMKSAFHAANQAQTTGKLLNRLFQHTFSVAKQVRTETEIGSNAVSVAYAGVSLAKRIFTDLSKQTVLLIGAGETIELVARHLKRHSVKHMIIANRTVEKSQCIAQELGSEAIFLGQIPSRLHESDIVVSSTSSMLPLLGKGAVEEALRQRRRKPIFILDLAVPRDVEPEVSKLRDVYLYTVDDLKSVVNTSREVRLRAAEQAESIIDLQVVRFMRWMRSLKSVPTIRVLRDNIDAIKNNELAKATKKLRNGKDPEKILEQLARDLANKFVHKPIEILKQADIEGNAHVISEARKLFDL